MNTTSQHPPAPPAAGTSGDTIVGFAVLGCLVAGAVGLFKALVMSSGLDVLLCLLGSAACFAVVLHLCLNRK